MQFGIPRGYFWKVIVKKLIGLIVIWFAVITLIFQIITIHNIEILEDKMLQVETKTYNYSVEVENLKTEIKEYREQTERLFDQNLKLITEGGWK